MARQPPEHAEQQRLLGQYLAALRKAADLYQTDIAREVPCHRTNVAHAEAGSQLPDTHFWETADRVVKANGALIARYDAFIRAKLAHAARLQAQRRAAADAAVRQLHTANTVVRQLSDSNDRSPGGGEARSVTPVSAHRAPSVEEILMDAADESVEILPWVETTNVGDRTIEQIQAEIRRIAHSYLKVPTMPLFHR